MQPTIARPVFVSNTNLTFMSVNNLKFSDLTVENNTYYSGGNHLNGAYNIELGEGRSIQNADFVDGKLQSGILVEADGIRWKLTTSNTEAYHLPRFKLTEITSTMGGVPREYIGELNSQLQKHGKGEMKLSSGNYFSGTYDTGKSTGGKMVMPNGESYHLGEMSNGKVKINSEVSFEKTSHGKTTRVTGFAATDRLDSNLFGRGQTVTVSTTDAALNTVIEMSGPYTGNLSQPLDESVMGSATVTNLLLPDGVKFSGKLRNGIPGDGAFNKKVKITISRESLDVTKITHVRDGAYFSTDLIMHKPSSDGSESKYSGTIKENGTFINGQCENFPIPEGEKTGKYKNGKFTGHVKKPDGTLLHVVDDRKTKHELRESVQIDGQQYDIIQTTDLTTNVVEIKLVHPIRPGEDSYYSGTIRDNKYYNGKCKNFPHPGGIATGIYENGKFTGNIWKQNGDLNHYQDGVMIFGTNTIVDEAENWEVIYRIRSKS